MHFISEISLIILMPDAVVEFSVSGKTNLKDIKLQLKNEMRLLINCQEDYESYIFSGVSKEAEIEEYYDETQLLCNLNLIDFVLKIIPRKTNFEESHVNAMINQSIGLCLDEHLHSLPDIIQMDASVARKKYFEDAKEIYDTITKSNDSILNFLYASNHTNTCSMRVNSILQSLDKLEIVSYIVCPFIEKIRRTSQISKNSDVGTTIIKLLTNFKDCYNYNRKDDLAKWAERESHSYVLKVSSFNEFMIDFNVKLIQYDYVQNCLYSNETPILSLYSIKDLKIESLSFFTPAYYYRDTNLSLGSVDFVSEIPFCFHVKVAKNVSKERTKIFVKAGLFSGTSAKFSSEVHSNLVPDDKPEWNQMLEFNVLNSNLPRNARLCISLVQKLERREVVLGTSSLNVFDYNGKLIEGCLELDLEPCIEGAYFKPKSVSHFQENSIKLVVQFVHLRKNLFNDTYKKQTVMNSKARELSIAIIQRIKQIVEKDFLLEMVDQDKDFLRANMTSCLSVVDSLPKLAKSINWFNGQEVLQFYGLLENWGEVKLESALQLLSGSFFDTRLRKFAVNNIERKFVESKSDIVLYLLQLVQALKYESYMYNDLGSFLLRMALSDRTVGQQFFWYLRSEVHQNSIKIYFSVLLEAFCRGFYNFSLITYPQCKAVNRLLIISKAVKEVEDNRQLDRLKELFDNDFKNDCENIYFMLNSNQKVGLINPDHCQVMKSKKRPLMLEWTNPDFFCDSGNLVLKYIFKQGDDLRQDILTLQLLKLFDWIWKRQSRDMKLIPYGCLATGKDVGLIEVVKNSKTIMAIQRMGIMNAIQINSESIYYYLKQHNSNQEEMRKAVKNFTDSCAGYSVATFILGIRDRHNDNIMIHRNGFMFHIDFGHILNNCKKKFGINRERVPFVLTEDFLYVIGDGMLGSRSQELFQNFAKLCQEAYIKIRRHSNLILTLFSLMIDTGLPELSSLNDLEYIKKTLQVDKTDEVALEYFKKQIYDAYSGRFSTKIDWLAHFLQNWI